MQIRGKVRINYEAGRPGRRVMEARNLSVLKGFCSEISGRTRQVDKLRIAVHDRLHYDGSGPGRIVHSKMVGTEPLAVALKEAGVHEIEFLAPHEGEEVGGVVDVLLTRSAPEAKRLLQEKNIEVSVFEPAKEDELASRVYARFLKGTPG